MYRTHTWTPNWSPPRRQTPTLGIAPDWHQPYSIYMSPIYQTAPLGGLAAWQNDLQEYQTAECIYVYRIHGEAGAYRWWIYIRSTEYGILGT